MPWKALETFREPAIPKLDNLRRAARRGLVVPKTVWAWARDLEGDGAAAVAVAVPVDLGDGPWIVRSGSPTEDTRATSNAGQFLTLVVPAPGAFADAVARVVAALPRRDGKRLGAVFVQPVVAAELAGVTFFDGFYYEETHAVGGNAALTSGRERGDVRRGHLQRGDEHSAWLSRVHAVFPGRIDLEWAEPTEGARVLLQVRPALFPIRRNETLSLANHKEILGDPPSPWMVGVIAAVSRPVMIHFFEKIDPAMAGWEEGYAVELGERGWLNFSAFYRIMDRWGMPRTMVTEGVGGESGGPLDARADVGRIIRSLPTIARLTVLSFWTFARIKHGLRALDETLARAVTLREIQRANVEALEFSVRTNFAIMTCLSAVVRFRRLFGIDSSARVITQRMMTEYAALAARADPADRLRGLDAWLAQYGHRGPLESDPRRPRFIELRDVLAADLARGQTPLPPPPRPTRLLARLLRPLLCFWLDEIREWFRDSLMRWWQTLRKRLLAEARAAVAAGWLDVEDDVFFLRAEDLDAGPETWRARVAARREAVERARNLDLPATASRDVIEAAILRAGRPDEAGSPDRFRGIGIGAEPVLGTAVRASELTALLNGHALPEHPILIVDTLEPSWAVVFPRFAAVVSALGGELSHASILLREAGIPAVINARGAFQAIADGDLVRVDPAWGEVRIEARRGAPAIVPQAGRG